MNPFQKSVKERVEKLDELIDSIDDNNLDLKNDVAEIEAELDKLEKSKEHKAACFIPGEKVNKLLTNWANEELMFDEDIKRYSNELWVSLEEFEK